MISCFIAGYSGSLGSAIFSFLKNKYSDWNIIPLNVRSWKDATTSVIISNLGERNVFVNCIWRGIYGMSHELSSQQYQLSFESNFLVPLEIIQLFSAQCISNSRQWLIININSRAAREAFFQGSAYNSMKAALSMSLNILAKEYKKKSIRVIEMFPGVIQSNLIKDMPYIPANWVQSIEDFLKDFENILKEHI